MAGLLLFLVIAGGISVLVAGAVWAYRKDQARIAALRNLALAKGWHFARQDVNGLPNRWQGAPFGKGYDRRASNVLTGEAGGYPMLAFDYTYKEDSNDTNGRRTTKHHYAICAVGMPGRLPELHVAPEGVFGRLGVMLGMQDIELESEEFNRRYRVRCPDPKLAVDVLTPRTMELLLHYGKVHFRFAGGDAIVYEPGMLNAVDLLNRTGLLGGVLAGVPSFVWKDHSAP
jgi:hypothetical protein